VAVLAVLVAISCGRGRDSGPVAPRPVPAGAHAAPAAPATPAASARFRPGAGRVIVFRGMCDASGAVALSDRLFAVADDEDNVLRVYDADTGGQPLASADLSPELLLYTRKKAPELDLEAATRLGERALWLTSHGRSKKGKLRPERLRLFATTAPADLSPPTLVGRPYEHLLRDLIADPGLARFDLARAAELPPKAPGGLNLEGMTAVPGGGVMLAFRNPVPGGRALLVPLRNPGEVITGAAARFGQPVILDLGGQGVRSLSWWRGRYLIMAGHFDSGGPPSRLFTWTGQGEPELMSHIDLSALNPEGFFSPDQRDEILLLSDDGSALIDGQKCKTLRDPGQKRFRGVWVSLGA
jgi:hypothetical protein